MDQPGLTRSGLYLTIGFLIVLAACSDSGAAQVQSFPSELPDFETNAVELQRTYDTVTANADQKLARLAALADQPPEMLEFANTVLAYDEITDEVWVAAMRAMLLKDVHPDPEILAKATALSEQYMAWFNATANNGGVYRTLLAYAKKAPVLALDEQRLLDDALIAFRSNGITEDGVVKPEVLRLQREMVALQIQIDESILEANAQKNYFTTEELAGLDAEQLAALPREGDKVVILSGAVGTLGDVLMTFASREETRKRARRIMKSRASDNIGLVTTLVQKRVELAKLLGFATWADYKTQIAMAKTGATASGFVDSVSSLLGPKLQQELAVLSSFVQPGINDDNGQIDIWDVPFFQRLYEKQLAVDYQSLAKYFPYDQVVRGMFDAYEAVFGLKIDFVADPTVWHPDVKLVRLSERSGSAAGETVGFVYLDNFPRLAQGKLGHFQTAPLILGKDLGGGNYRKPVAVLICNFPVNADGTPANLLFSDIDILFHEFGHALHLVLGKARFASQSPFDSPIDFVEVPSTLSQLWRLDPMVFKMMAIPDPALTDEFVHATIAAMKTAGLATTGLTYQAMFGSSKVDFMLHTLTDASQIPAAVSAVNLAAMANQAWSAVYLPAQEGTSPLSSFQHVLTWGYDAGYYSYTWSDSIVAELAEVFEAPGNPLGYMNPALGASYRSQILEPGNARDVATSVAAFTGHALDPERKAFLRRLGIQ